MNEINHIVLKQKRFFAKGETKNVEYRIRYLQSLRDWIRSHDNEIMEALKKDLNKAEFEAYETEIFIVLDEIKYALKNIRQWTRKKRVKTPITQFPAQCYIYHEPYGSVLIMSPWNYPFQLTIAPLVGAIAAGNCAVVKPSAYSEHTSALISTMIKELFSPEYVAVIEGGRKENETLLNQKFDYIFFTGSVAVGKLVMSAAAKHLTPISLELGGKSPCIVDQTANIKLAAKRIIWGKFLNAGQTCVAPDYVLVHHNVKQKLVEQMKIVIHAFYGATPCENEDYPKIINEKHFSRLSNLLQDGNVLSGGGINAGTRQIDPTIIDNINWESAIMQEEIFGPILPILEFNNLKQVVKMVNKRPKPLALYYFTRNKENERYIIKNISYGGGCINDTVVHLVSSDMPFGGVGESGIGGYHGKASFNTFSHPKSILKKSLLIDIPLRYPPYKNHLKVIKKL